MKRVRLSPYPALRSTPTVAVRFDDRAPFLMMLDMGYVQNNTWRSFPGVSSILHNLLRTASSSLLEENSLSSVKGRLTGQGQMQNRFGIGPIDNSSEYISPTISRELWWTYARWKSRLATDQFAMSTVLNKYEWNCLADADVQITFFFLPSTVNLN